MEQIDSRIQFISRSSRALELFKQKHQWNGTFNGAFVSVLVLFGVIGVLTVLYLQAAKAASTQVDKKVILTANRQAEQPNNAKAVVMVTEEEYNSEFVSVIGDLVRQKDISIIIDSYDPKAEYVLDMGNGTKLPVTQREVIINYPGPGIYYPVMEVSFKGETERVALQKLWIR